MRFSGSDMRETLSAVCTPEELGIVEALLTGSGSTWEGIAYEARSLMDSVSPDLDEDGQLIAQAMFLGGYLSGLAQLVVKHMPDEGEEPQERAA